MKLIIGLGNPGQKYKNTRHNVGFLVIEQFCKVNECSEFQEKHLSEISENFLNDKKYLLCKPLTFMNLSGLSVKQICDYYDIVFENCLLIYDDINLSSGKFKLSQTSSPGGHNGVDNVKKMLNNNNFLKLKIGIGGFKLKEQTMADYVLGGLSIEEKKLLNMNYSIIMQIITDFISGIDTNILMNKYNKKKN